MEQKQRLKGTQGEVELELRLQAGILSVFINGYLDRVLGAAIVEQATVLTRASQMVNIFLDFSMMTGFDSSVREMMRRAKSQFGKRLTVHVLTSTKIHAMFIAVARLTLGETLVGYTDRDAFAQAHRSALGGHGGN